MRLPLGLQLMDSSSPGTGSFVEVWTPSRVHILTTLLEIESRKGFNTNIWYFIFLNCDCTQNIESNLSKLQHLVQCLIYHKESISRQHTPVKLAISLIYSGHYEVLPITPPADSGFLRVCRCYGGGCSKHRLLGGTFTG